ncbi:putative heterokaryon incompatibility protein [Colletotrichum sublineola]|uniref:Putative heterokaryon incompatibility protein n=1 Tax=Colletotrichum sublineola TaxID=1173701 RepID=A0A066XQ01_COLSU|nr:putative heterokaryon incompatibility protein [Colletotrichum sublineola]
MLCKVCKDGLEGMWDPNRSKRLALLKDFDLDFNWSELGGDDGVPTSDGTWTEPDPPVGLPPEERPEASVPYLPSRLIKLETPETFRLVQGTECPVGTRYVALSYCWGTKPVDSLLRLLQSTAKSLYLEQPVDILPKTFRHALEIIQRFEIRYIWIDRLCIFQDSAEDWQKEASTMQSVHRNAYIGISALEASDDDGGCFFERDPSKVTTTVVSFKLKEDGEEKAFRSDREKRWSWRHLFESEPVVQRSWVVQERLLAPRTLHFGSKQVFWECREASCSETQPQGVYEFVYEAEQDLNESNGDNETNLLPFLG